MKKWTEQEMFDKSMRGLRDQNAKSEKDHTCLYRGPNGRKCAIGHLITDKQYKPKMERKAIGCAIFEKFFPGISYGFKTDLQLIHDYYDVDSWPWRAYVLAKHYKLKYKHLIFVRAAFGRTYYAWIPNA